MSPSLSFARAGAGAWLEDEVQPVLEVLDDPVKLKGGMAGNEAATFPIVISGTPVL